MHCCVSLWIRWQVTRIYVDLADGAAPAFGEELPLSYAVGEYTNADDENVFTRSQRIIL